MSTNYEVRIPWAITLAMSSVLFILTWWVPVGGTGYALIIYTLLGVPAATTVQMPWDIVTTCVQGSDDAGAICTAFRIGELMGIVVVGVAG